MWVHHSHHPGHHLHRVACIATRNACSIRIISPSACATTARTCLWTLQTWTALACNSASSRPASSYPFSASRTFKRFCKKRVRDGFKALVIKSLMFGRCRDWRNNNFSKLNSLLNPKETSVDMANPSDALTQHHRPGCALAREQHCLGRGTPRPMAQLMAAWYSDSALESAISR